MVTLLDLLSGALSVLIAGLLLTGGTVVHLPLGTLELSSLDAWIAALIALLALRGNFPGRSPTLRTLDRLLKFFSDPRLGGRRTWGLFFGTVASLVLAHCLKQWSFQTDYFDQSVIHPALYQPWGELGRPLLRCDECGGGSYLGAHLAFIFFPLSLLIPVARDEWVFVLQVLLPCIAVLLALRASELGQSRRTWFFALLPLLSSRAFRSGLVWDFREDLPAFCLLLGAGAALSRKRIGIYFAFLVSALLCKENVALVCLLFTFPILFAQELGWSRRKRWVVAATTLLVSGLYAGLAFGVLLPLFNPEISKNSDIVKRLGEFGGTPAEILTHILFSPAAWWTLFKTRLLSWDRLKYLVLLTGPFAFYFRRVSIPWLVPALAGILMNLFSNLSEQRSLHFHYDWIILPFLVLGAWKGLATFQQRLHAGQTRLIAAYLLLAVLLFSGRWPGWEISHGLPSAADFAATRELVSLAHSVPPGIDVAMNSRLLAQLDTQTQLSARLYSLHPQARTLILDLKVPEEDALHRRLSAQGWRSTRTRLPPYPSRFVLMQAP